MIFIVLPLTFLFLANASSKTTVTNRVSEGDVRIETKITTQVNGQSTTVESNQPGTIEVQNTNGKVEIQTGNGVTTSTPSSTSSQKEAKSVATKIYLIFQGFLQKLRALFGIHS